MIDEWTSIVTTAIVTSSLTLTTVETASVTVTTTAIVAAEYSDSNNTGHCSTPAISTRAKDKNDWEVADAYWTTDTGLESSEAHNGTLPTKSGEIPVDIDCILTILSNNFGTTVTIKQSGPTPTYTHTTFVATETSTLTARTSRDKYENTTASAEIWEWNDVTWFTVYQTSITTTTVTVRTLSANRSHKLTPRR